MAEGILYYEQLKVAGEAADLQKDQIRQQQVELRLQQNQSELVRINKLRHVLATEEVQLGVRNVSPLAGTSRALTEENFQNFLADQNANSLNYAAKQQRLNIALKQVDVQKRAQYIAATAGFVKELEQSAAAASGGYGSVPFGGSRGGGYGSNLIDYNDADNLNINA